MSDALVVSNLVYHMKQGGLDGTYDRVNTPASLARVAPKRHRNLGLAADVEVGRSVAEAQSELWLACGAHETPETQF